MIQAILDGMACSFSALKNAKNISKSANLFIQQKLPGLPEQLVTEPFL
jgi:hypothetical protein